MHFSALALTLLPIIARADFTIWLGSCADGGDGGEFEDDSLSTDAQGACGGCSLSGSPGDDGITGGNPCAASCADDTLVFNLNGDNYDIIVQSTGINVGSCNPTTGPNAACQVNIFACSEVGAYRCVTSYCS